MDKRKHLLMVDDEIDFCKLVQDYFTAYGFDIAVVHDGEGMSQYLSENAVDLILLDVMLPGENGLSLAQRLRAGNNQKPIIMLSAIAKEEVDRIKGLEIGADDYLVKPVSLGELLARVRAVLRRYIVPSIPPTDKPQPPQNYRFGPFTLNVMTHRLLKANVEVTVTTTEYNLLLAFVTQPNEVLSRDKLMNFVKGCKLPPYDRSIDVGVRRLREKIEVKPSTPSYIRTIHGKGYLFSPRL